MSARNILEEIIAENGLSSNYTFRPFLSRTVGAPYSMARVETSQTWLNSVLDQLHKMYTAGKVEHAKYTKAIDYIFDEAKAYLGR